MRGVLILVVCLLVLSLTASAARAEESPRLVRSAADSSEFQFPCAATGCGTVYERPFTMAPRKRWHAVLAAYMWAPSISGTNYASGEETDIDIAFSDLFDKLDGAFMGYAEFRYERFSIAIDAFYVGLEEDGVLAGSGIPYEADFDQTILDFRLGYAVLCRNVGRDTWGGCCYDRSLTLDAILGVRYWDLNADLTATRPQTGTQEIDGDTDWWDPYVGARFRWPFAKRWEWSVYGDIGGFDIGDGSALTWQVQTYLSFKITRTFFVALGYRALDVDRTEGSGTGKNGLDTTFHGPVIGLGFSF